MFVSDGEERAYRAAQSTDREWETKLSVLIQQWRERAAVAHAQHTLSGDVCRKVYIQCANELQEILDAR